MSTAKQERQPEPPLSENGLKSLISYALNRGYIQESDHATDDHPERNLSLDDVIHGLEREDWKLIRNISLKQLISKARN